MRRYEHTWIDSGVLGKHTIKEVGMEAVYLLLQVRSQLFMDLQEVGPKSSRFPSGGWTHSCSRIHGCIEKNGAHFRKYGRNKKQCTVPAAHRPRAQPAGGCFQSRYNFHPRDALGVHCGLEV